MKCYDDTDTITIKKIKYIKKCKKLSMFQIIIKIIKELLKTKR